MGPPLYQPAGSVLYLSDLEPGEPGEPAAFTRRQGSGPTLSPKHHRPYHRVTHAPAERPGDDYHPSILKPAPPPPSLAPRSTSQHPPRPHNWPSYPLPKTPKNADELAVEAREGRDLARSACCGLPRRRPSLEREEAFCGARPARKRCHLDVEAAEEDDDDGETVRELYRLGLLYDDPHERGDRFGLDAIVHDGPVYSVRAAGGRRGGGKRRAKEERRWAEVEYALPLELSFAQLGDDELVARFLLEGRDAKDCVAEQPGAAGWREVESGLRVVYELDREDGGRRSMDSAHGEIQSLSAAEAFPELVSDSEQSDGVDWEVLDDGESSSDGGTAGPEAWVVLG